VDLLAVAEDLYALTPGEFTAARNEHTKAAKADGDKDLAARIGQLRRPSVAAWVVNMLMRHHGEEMAQVLELGESLRQAQADLDGEALRELTRQRRRLIAAVTGTARALAADLGEKVSDTVARQVEDTLHSAMVDENAAAAVRTGMLTEPLAPSGLGSLDIEEAVADRTALGRTATRAEPPSRKRAELSVVPEEEPDEEERRHEELTAARARLDEARTAADKAAKKLDKAEKRVAKLEARALQVQGELDELRRKVAGLEHEAETIDGESEAAEEKRDRTARRQREADAELDEARSALERLDR
jgi:hypothetical protein